MSAVYSFEVWLKGYEQYRRVVNHRTLGKAKYAYLLDISDSFPDGLPFALVRGRKLGRPAQTPALERVAKYRGRPELVAGKRVKVDGAMGCIVDGNSSANFDVLFDDDAPTYAGAILNVHPLDIEVVP